MNPHPTLSPSPNPKYKITTFSAANLIQRYNVTRDQHGNAHIYYEINYGDSRELRYYIKSTEEYNDTALFYQIRQVVDSDSNTPNMIWDEQSLRNYIIYVDFESLFDKMESASERELKDTYSADDLSPKSKKIGDEYRIRALFKYGIHILYSDGDNITDIHYVPFDKSNSMSRQGKMSFINKNLQKDLNERLNLGMTFNNQRVSLSKFYAYRGLYLSEAKRCDFAQDILNSDTVVIIKDATMGMADQNIITAKNESGSNIWQGVEKKNAKYNISSVFDGEGIISPKYTELINETCHFAGATSFQVRMPFIKGMLHTVDFHSFIKEFVGDVESYKIEDIYGVDRDLMKAHIIMPESMFKCKKWLEKEIAINLLQVNKTSYMDYYFQKFHQYRHALYISNTNLGYGKSALTKLNYQLLNTLALDDNAFAALIESHLRWARNPVEYLEKMDVDLECQSNEDDIDENPKQLYRYRGEVWKYALKHNPVFAHETKIKGILRGISNGLKYDCANGKIVVDGETRYLSRDLLKFLFDLIKDYNKDRNEYKTKGGNLFLHQDCFFMPQNKINLDKNIHYPIVRNPHLSRNEECALKPYIKSEKEAEQDLYYRYFSHLSGVIMVAYNSLVPQALGGADFDGDLVKIIDDKYVRNAVLHGVYQNYKRVLPIIEIPSVNGTQSQVTDEIDYNIIKDTFSNKIGQISNLSIRLGSIEYRQNNSIQKTNSKYSCAECTILTGLEIDAAKTGRHPDLTEIMTYAKSVKLKFDYISDFKKKIDSLRFDYFFSAGNLEIQGNNYRIKKNKYTPAPLISYVFSDDMHGIDRLPKYFFGAISEKCNLSGGEFKENGRYMYFDFLKDDNWKNEIGIYEDISQKIGAVIIAYYNIVGLYSKIYRYRKSKLDKGYEGYIRTILKLQYDREDYDEIEELLEKLFAFIDSKFQSRESINEAMRVLKASNWPFLLETQKKNVILQIFNCEDEPDFLKVLYNFDAQGYNLLFYILKDAESLCNKEVTEDVIADEFKKENKESVVKQNENRFDSAYFNKFYDRLYEKFIAWRLEKNSSWKYLTLEYCKREIDKLLSGINDKNHRLYIMYSMTGSRNPDKNNTFFWEYATLEDIDEHVIKVEGNSNVG